MNAGDQEFNAALQNARRLIHRKQTPEALQALNSLASRHAGDQVKLGEITCTIAAAEFHAGRFSKAAEYYRQATDKLVAVDKRKWFSPALAEVRSLIKDVRPSDALQRAQWIWQKGLEQHQEREQQLALSLQNLQKAKRVRVGKRPVRASVIATKVGKAFLHEGETEAAKTFFEEAIKINPSGASRAREALARIALAEDDPAEAERRAREALLLGRYQAKTVSMWPLLIEARQKQEKTGLEAEQLAGLRSIKKEGLRARALLNTLTTLRGYGDELWRQLSDEIPASAKEVALQVEFIQLRQAKLDFAPPLELASRAQKILNNPVADAIELVAAAKEYVRAGLLANQAPDVWSIRDNVQSRVGQEHALQALHAMALGAMLARRYDLARPILQWIINNVPAGSVQWGKSCWAMARMELLLKNYDTAAQFYLTFSEKSSIPQRFRVQAIVKWLEAMREGNLGIDGAAARARVEQILGDVAPTWETLLDVSRQLTFGGSELQELRQQIANQAEQKALQAFEAAQHPAEALHVLLRLSRRQFYDLGRQAQVVAQWDSLPQQKRDWLWNESSDWWEYLSLVFKSLARSERAADAVELATAVIDSSDAPPQGYIHLGVAYADWLATSGRRAEALEHFRWIVQDQPTHRLAAEGWYHLMRNALERNDLTQAQTYAANVRQCYSGKPALLSEWELDAQALLVLHNQDVDAALAQEGTYGRPFIERQLQKLIASRNLRE